MNNNTFSPFPPGYTNKVKKITSLAESGPTSAPSEVDAAEIFHEVLHDTDFRIRVRAMAVLPFVRDREHAIEVLIQCMYDRDPASSGGGNVPLYAARCLAEMKATRAIPAVADWVDYLGKNPPYDLNAKALMLRTSDADLSRLRQAASTQPAL